MSVCRRTDLLKQGWRIRLAGLLVMAALAVVMGTGLAHTCGEAPLSSNGVPLAAPSGTLDPAVWTTPLGSLNFSRLSDGRQRLGQLLALAQPRPDSTASETAGATAAIVALILLRLLARRDHGVRAPPLQVMPSTVPVQRPAKR